VLTDVPVADGQTERELRRELVQKAPAGFPAQGELLKQLHRLLASELPLGALCDIVLFALTLDIEAKQQLLEELDVESRVRRLLQMLEPAAGRKFPPEFSSN
jgi:hypothetical protein